MNKFAVTYSTVSTLLNNADARNVSSMLKTAYEKINTEIKTEGCSACAKRKKANQVITEVMTGLQNASDLELDRLKKVLNVDAFVFGNGLSFTER